MTTRVRILMLALVVAGCAGCPNPLPSLVRFTSADTANQGWFGDGLLAPGAAEDTMEGAQDAVSREVIEPDVIRRSGNVLYVLNQYRGLTLTDLDAQTIVAQVPTYGYPRDLYLTEGRAYVLVGNASEYAIEDDTVSFEVEARLYVIDVTEPAQAAILGTFDLEGDLVDSRLVGDVLYAVCAEYEWYWAGWIEGVGVGVDAGVAVTRPVKTQTSESWATSINVADPANIHQAAEISFPGLGNVIQATDTAIFVAASDWDWQGGDEGTTITYVDISDPDGAMTTRDTIAVPGYVADRFKMDAYNGVLRVISSGWWDDQRVYITTVDLTDPDNLVELGQYDLEEAAGETLFATRFDGDRAYIVTYFMVDPLFVVDLSDPAQPAVVGTLEVPGWSTHIEPMGDRLVALGVDDTDGRRVCVSLFDVADPTDPAFPALVDRVSFGEDWSWSSAYDDVKAFTVLDDLLIVPFSGWSHDAGGYERLQFVSYNDEDLATRGTVDLEGAILRSFEYEDRYYGVTTEQLATINGADLDQPEVTHRLTLAEYVADFIELSPTLAVEIVIRHDTDTLLVRTVGLEKRGLGEVAAPMGDLAAAYAYGDGVVLVGRDWGTWGEETWTEAPHYIVAMVDCSDPATPVAATPVRIDVQPYGGFYWYGPEEGRLDKDAKQMIAPWWIPWDSAPETFLLGDRLVLRCHAETFDTVVGAERNAYEGLAVLDLTDAALPYTTIGLGYQDVTSLDAAGEKLYLTRREAVAQASVIEWRMPLCAYYVHELDVAAPAIGPGANVPGMFVQYSPADQVLMLKDYQWELDGAAEVRLRTVRWDGASPVDVLENVALPAGANRVLGRGDKVYVDGYDEGYRLYVVAVGADGQLSLGDGVLVTDQWASLLDAHGDSAYVSIGNAIARYDFAADGALADFVEVMGSPLRVRFGSAQAFVSLGYFGMAVLPL